MSRIIILSLIVLTCISCSHKGDTLLRLQYKRGDVMDIRYRTYIVPEDDENDPVRNESVRMGFTVDSVISDSIYVLKANFYYVRIDNKAALAMRNEEYYSDEDEADMSANQRKIHQQLKPVLDSTYKIVVNNRGKVIKPFSFAGGRYIPQIFDPIDYEICQIVFPKEKISEGDEWTNERITH